jgi:hypothetical protein
MSQTPKRFARARLAGTAAFICFAVAPVVSHAQAWLPPKGSFSYSIDYSNILNKKHYRSDGTEVDVGHTDTNTMSVAGSYSPSDRLSISASLPVVRTRYRGAGGGGHDHEIDDGTWHSTITDLQVSVNYQVTQGRVAFAPFVGAIIPTHDYTTFGHSAPGRGLNEYWLGFYGAASLNEWIPRTYVQVRGNYAFVEEVQDIRHDRINASLEIGYFINQSWNVRALVSRQWTEGGIDVPVLQTSPLFPDHDVLAAEEFINVGAGATWIIDDRMSVYGLYMEAIEGTNAHKVDHRVSVGFSFGVGGH